MIATYIIADDNVVTVLEEGNETIVLVEDLADHLAKHYGDHVSADELTKAAEYPKDAIKLAYGLYKGIIDSVDDPDALTKVQNLKPVSPEKEAKQSRKSSAEIEFESLKADARNLNVDYWPWIVRVWKSHGRSYDIDVSWFDYLEGTGQAIKDVLEKPPEEIAAESRQWHEEQYSNQKTGGTYKNNPDSENVINLGSWWLIPVDSLPDAEVEGEKMQNCIGGQCKPTNDYKIWSMRNKFNNPSVSIGVKRSKRNKWVLDQVKGKQNAIPIDKYRPAILRFIEYIISDNQPLGIPIRVGGRDIWNIIDESDPWKWIIKTEDPVDALKSRPSIVAGLTEPQAALLLSKHGEELQDHAANTSEDTVSILEQVISKADAAVVENIVSNQKVNHSFVKAAIKHRKLSRELATELAREGEMRRGAKMVILAVYEPEKFIEEISRMDPEDTALAIENYQDGIETYIGHHPYFDKLLDLLMVDGAKSQTIKIVLNKTTPQKVYDVIKHERALDTLKIGDQWVGIEGRDELATAFALKLLTSKLPISVKIDGLNTLIDRNYEIGEEKEQYEFPHGYVKRFRLNSGIADYIQSLNLSDLVYASQNAKGHLAKIAKKVAKAIGKVEDDATQYGLDDYVGRAEDTDDIGELKTILSQVPRKGPGPLLRVRRYIGRKIARLERLELQTT